MAETTGLRTKVYRSEDGTTFTLIGQLANAKPPSKERQMTEVEELDPPGDVPKKLAGLLNVGDVTLTLNLDPENQGHLALDEDVDSGEVRTFRIVLPVGYGWTFRAIVSNFDPQEIGPNDVVQAQVTLSVVEKPQFGLISDI